MLTIPYTSYVRLHAQRNQSFKYIREIMKARLLREGTGSNYTTATRSFWWARFSTCVLFFQPVGKRYPLKAVRTLKKKKKKWKKKKIISFRQNLLGSIRPFPEPIQFFVLGASLSYRKPPKRGRTNQRRDCSKRIEPGNVQFCFWPQEDAFRSGRAHQWLSGDLTGENFSAHNH